MKTLLAIAFLAFTPLTMAGSLVGYWKPTEASIKEVTRAFEESFRSTTVPHNKIPEGFYEGLAKTIYRVVEIDSTYAEIWKIGNTMKSIGIPFYVLSRSNFDVVTKGKTTSFSLKGQEMFSISILSADRIQIEGEGSPILEYERMSKGEIQELKSNIEKVGYTDPATGELNDAFPMEDAVEKGIFRSK